MKTNGFRIVLMAMFASMVCVCTMVPLPIPSPVGGYINLGDALVLMSGFLLGPLHGAAAAGLGSALADLFAGYVAYAPGTLVIKFAVAAVAGLLSRTLAARASKLHPALRCALSGLPAEAVMVLGYLCFSAVFLGYGAAAVGEVPGNLVQAAAGIVISTVLTPVVSRPREIRELLEKFNTK